MTPEVRSILRASAEASARLNSIRMRRAQWSFFYSMDGRLTLSELAIKVGLTQPEALATAEKLISAGLAEEAEISVATYLATAGVGDTSQEEVDVETFVKGSAPSESSVTLEMDWGTPSEPAAPRPRVLNLNLVIRDIIQETHNPIAVYTIFLKIPPAVMQRNFVYELPLSSSSKAVLVQDIEFHQCLERAMAEKLGRGIPAEAWVD